MCEKFASCPNTNENQQIKIAISFNQLVREPVESTAQSAGIKYLCLHVSSGYKKSPFSITREKGLKNLRQTF
jgi:hypothetical protein